MVSATGIVAGSGVFLVGLAILGLGLATARQWFWLARQPPGDVHQASEGPVEFVGTAQPLETYGVVRSGLTGEECLCYEYTVEQASDGRHGKSWHEIASGSDGVPFVVRDETGRVLVDPDGAKTVLREEYETHLDPGEEPSEAVESFLARSDVDRDSYTVDIGITELQFGDEQRFREHRIHPGETVYVAGVADLRVGDYDVGFGGPDAVVRVDRDRGRFRRYLEYPFVISDRSESAAQRSLLARAGMVVAIGGVTVLGGGYVVALSLG